MRSQVRTWVCATVVGAILASYLVGVPQASPVECREIPEPARWVSSGEPDQGSPDPLVSSHRGALRLAPENTMWAYRYSFAYDVDMVEVDVRETRDGRYVAFHDSTIGRTTDAPDDDQRSIRDLTFEEVRALNAAAYGRWLGGDYDPARIASLEEVLELAAAVGGGIEFDIKDVDDPTKLVDMAAEYGVLEESIFNTGDPRIIAGRPEARIIYNLDSSEPPGVLYGVGTRADVFGSKRAEFSPERVAEIHDACGLVMPHSYDQGDDGEAAEIEAIRAMGGDGAQTNQPDVAADALDKPVATRIEVADDTLCLVNSENGHGLPEKPLQVTSSSTSEPQPAPSPSPTKPGQGKGRDKPKPPKDKPGPAPSLPPGPVTTTETTGVGGCVPQPDGFVEASFDGDGSALSSSTSNEEQPPPPPSTNEEYVGALHEHSGYSDGWPGSRPEDYFMSARLAGLDFLGSGEHSDNSDIPPTLNEECIPPASPAPCAVADKEEPANNFRKWDATLDRARATTTDEFTAFRGFEWSSDRFGHINVYFSDNNTSAYRDGGFATMETFGRWFTTEPSLGGGADGLATFNHPGDKKLSTSDPAFNWNDFEYRPEVDERMVGIEVFNGNKDYVTRGWYTRALDKGWHVGAVGVEDLGHIRPETACDDPALWDTGAVQDRCWGHPRWGKTVLIAEDRSEAVLEEAMAARRMYATLGADIRIELDAGGNPMGSRFSVAEGTRVPFRVGVPTGAERLEVVTDGGEIVAASAGDSLSFEIPVTGGEHYYFVSVFGPEGPIAYTSPVWITGD